jgi:hypothetical protein
MTETPTLLKALLTAEHAQKYETFCDLYARTARDMGAPELAKTTPGKAQYYRWLGGQLKGGTPYPDACRVLEHMFPGRTATELFMPRQTTASTSEVTASQQEFQAADIVSAFASRADFAAAMTPAALIENAHEVRAAGLSLNVVCQQIPADKLQAFLEGGGTLRALFLDPQGEAIAAREREEDLPPGMLSSLTDINIRMLAQHVCPRLSPEAKQRLLIATYDETVRFNLLLVDDQLGVVQPYLPVVRGIDSPTLVLAAREDGTGLLPTFRQVFDTLWERGKPL